MCENKGKSSLWKYAMGLGILFGFCCGLVVYGLLNPVKHVEISPRAGMNTLDFYVIYLKSRGYIVTDKNLSVNDYREAEDFKEFLWLLEYGNITECYVDYGYDAPVFVFGQRRYRVAKLWFLFDGVYWELRIEDV